MKKYCAFCGKELTTNQRHNTYCSPECHKESMKKEKIENWLKGDFNGLRQGGQISVTIRNYLIEKVNNKCELCGWGQINPTTNKVPLEIHHKDGNYLNNNIDNLQVLCPNCHSLTPNYKALNKSSSREDRTTNRKARCIECGAEICQGSLRCRACENKRRITEKPLTREELKEKIRKLPFTTIGKEYGVTDNTIKKWCKRYNLPFLKKEINSYSDKEWEKI